MASSAAGTCSDVDRLVASSRKPVEVSSRSRPGIHMHGAGIADRNDIYGACCSGKLENVAFHYERLGKQSRTIDRCDREGFTPLHYAVRYNHIKIVSFLLEHNANTNIHGGRDKATPLHLAARYKVCSSLRKAGSNQKASEVPSPGNDSVKGSFHQREQRSYSQSQPSSTLKVLNPHSKASFDSCGVPIDLSDVKRSKVSCSSQHKACDSIISLLLSNGADVNARDADDATPLHYASMRRNISAVEELLSYKGIKLEWKDSSWMTSLHYAAEQGCTPVASMLLACGADIFALNRSDMTPLHLAAEEGHPEVAELLIEQAIKKNFRSLKGYINSKDRYSQTALHYSAISGSGRLVETLLKHDADPSIISAHNLSTPLHLACSAGNIDVVKLLLEKYPALAEERNGFNETPLHIAASLNREDIVTYLLEKGVDVNCCDKDHETPIMMAAKKDNINIVKLLIHHNVNYLIRDSNDYTPLHVAALNNSLRCADYFLNLDDSKAMQNSWDCQENRPIHLAVRNNHIDMIKKLLDKEAPVESKNEFGHTPLLIAVVHGHLHAVKLLMDHCPSLALDEDDFSNTALHLASEYGHFRLIHLLVNSGIAINSRNINQLTPLDLAAFRGNMKVAAALIESEASLDPTESSKLSPLLVACEQGHPEVVTLLVNSGSDVARLDGRGRNCLDIAIDENRKSVALALIKSDQWEVVLRHVSVYCGEHCTPFRRLIGIMPEVAEVVLDKCLTNNGLPISHPKFEFHCRYEFLEDVNSSWGDMLKTEPALEFSKKDGGYGFRRLTQKVASLFKLFRINSYSRFRPLSLIIEKKRVTLLGHPLVRYLIRSKWRRLSGYLYYARMMFLLIYIFFLTSFCILTATPPYPCSRDPTYHFNTHSVEPMNFSYVDDVVGCIYCPLVPDKKDTLSLLFVSFGKYLLMFLAFSSLCMRITAFVMDIANIINAQNVLEFMGSSAVLVFVSGAMSYNGRPVEIFKFYRCTNVFRSVGALSLCFIWLSFVLFLSKLPKVGIYVVMYTDIFRTFLQFMPVYFMLLISFALPFYMLFLDRHDVNAYTTPMKSVIKVFLGMIGEVEYDTFYNTSSEPPLTMAYVLLFLFVISNSIILMNLLVGLAVDDIQGVQSNAFLKRLGLQVQLSMEIESVLPERLLKKYELHEEVVLPNEPRHAGFWSLWEFKANPFDKQIVDEETTCDPRTAELHKDVRDSLKALKHQMKAVSERTQKIEAVLDDLCRRTPRG